MHFFRTGPSVLWEGISGISGNKLAGREASALGLAPGVWSLNCHISNGKGEEKLWRKSSDRRVFLSLKLELMALRDGHGCDTQLNVPGAIPRAPSVTGARGSRLSWADSVAVDTPVWGWRIRHQELPVPHPSPDAPQTSVGAGLKWHHKSWLPSLGPTNATVRSELAPRPAWQQRAVLYPLEHHHPLCCFRKPSFRNLDSLKKNHISKIWDSHQFLTCALSLPRQSRSWKEYHHKLICFNRVIFQIMWGGEAAQGCMAKAQGNTDRGAASFCKETLTFFSCLYNLIPKLLCHYHTGFGCHALGTLYEEYKEKLIWQPSWNGCWNNFSLSLAD